MRETSHRWEQEKMLRKCWFDCYGVPVDVMTDPEGCIQDKHCRVWSACEDVKWDAQQGEAAWRTGVVDKVCDVIKNCAKRSVRRAHHDTSCEDIFDVCTDGRTERLWRRGHSPFQLLVRTSPPGLPPEDEKLLGKINASLTNIATRRLHIQLVV